MPFGILDSNPFSGVNPNTPLFGGVGQVTGAYNYPQALGGGNNNSYPNQAGQVFTNQNPVAGPPAPTYGPQVPQTYGPPAPTGGGGGQAPQQPQQQQQGAQTTQQTFDPYAALRNQISSGWDNYNSSLQNNLNNYLPGQQTAQNNIINDQYNQGVNTANQQKASSLKDIGNTVKSAFQAGNNYLGARGAGDSSAGDMFNFATNQQAAKQTSDLNQYVNSQLSGLSSQRDQQLNGVANWYAGQQQQIQSAIASGQLSKSQDLANLSSNILNQGLSMVNQIHQDAQSKYNALTQWAANNSGSLGQLQNNIAAIGNAPANPIQMDSSGNMQVPIGYGGAFGNNTNQNQNQNQSMGASGGSGTGMTTAGLFG